MVAYPQEWIKWKREAIPKIGEDVEWLELSSLLMGMETGTATLIKLAVLCSRKHICDSAVALLDTYTQEKCILRSLGETYKSVYSSTIQDQIWKLLKHSWPMEWVHGYIPTTLYYTATRMNKLQIDTTMTNLTGIRLGQGSYT